MNINIEEFYEMAVHPDFPDVMDFRITTANPENPYTFSREGVEGIVDQIDGYIMARTMGKWAKDGEPPKELTIHVSLEWSDHDSKDIVWYRWHEDGDDKGMEQIDGMLRIPRSLHKKK